MDNQEHKILIIDNTNNDIIKTVQNLPQEYEILTASDTYEALDILKTSDTPFSMIIATQQASEIQVSNFFEQASNLTPNTIRFLVIAKSDLTIIDNIINKGKIHNYILRPWDNYNFLFQIKQAIQTYNILTENEKLILLTSRQSKQLFQLRQNMQKKLQEQFNEEEKKVTQKNFEITLLKNRLEKECYNSMNLLISFIDTINPLLCRYLKNVANMAKKIAIKLDLDDKTVKQVEIAGLFHNIGLIGLPESSLHKNIKETDKYHEKIIFEHHYEKAYQYLTNIPNFQEAGEIILYHHEQYSKEVSDSLIKDKIPLTSHIIAAVSDYYKIVDLWPKDKKQIIEKFKTYFGYEFTQNSNTPPETMLSQIAKTALSLWSNHKYDKNVVTQLLNIVKENQNSKYEFIDSRFKKIDIDDVKEGMVLYKDLYTKDGKLLIDKGTKFKKFSSQAIKKLKKLGVIDDTIYIKI